MGPLFEGRRTLGWLGGSRDHRRQSNSGHSSRDRGLHTANDLRSPEDFSRTEAADGQWTDGNAAGDRNVRREDAVDVFRATAAAEASRKRECPRRPSVTAPSNADHWYCARGTPLQGGTGDIVYTRWITSLEGIRTLERAPEQKQVSSFHSPEPTEILRRGP